MATALGVAAHLPAVRGPFFSDDFPLVVDNSRLASIPLLEAWRIFAERASPWEYLPVRDLSYRIDLALFGYSPLGFHLVNVALFAISCAAAFLATRWVLRSLRGVSGDAFEDAAAVVATAVFAAHPAHVESVAWIASRKDLLSGIFGLACVWQFAAGISGERPRWRRIGCAAALFALGCLSKPSVLPAAPLLFLLAAARYSRDMALRLAVLRASLVAAPLLAVTVGAVALATTFRSAAMSRVEEDLFGSMYRPLGPVPLALRILGEFVWVAVAPFRLRLNHDVRMTGLAGAALLAAGGAAVVASAWGAWASIRRRSAVGFGVLAFVALTAPFLQVVRFRTSSEMCERWLFLPSFGIALAVGALAAPRVARLASVASVAVAALVAAAGLALTAQRSGEWTSYERLADADVARAPRDHGALSFALSAWGPKLRYEDARRAAERVEDPAFRERILLIADGWQAVAEGRIEDARRVVSKLASSGNFWRTKVAEGYLALRAGEDFEALRSYDGAGLDGVIRQIRELYAPKRLELTEKVRAEPTNVDGLEELGNLQSDLRLDEEAVATYRRALALAPDRAEVRWNLAMVLRRIGRVAEASEMYRSVADRLPDAWNEVAVCESALGRDGEAEQAFLKAIAAAPGDWKPAFNVALLYLGQRRPADARAMFLVARERAAASGLPVRSIDEQISRLGP